MALTKVSYSMISGSIKNIVDYGAVCDGTTNDTAAVQAAITAIGTTATTLFIPGNTKIYSALTFGANTQLNFAQGGKFTGNAGTELIQVQQQIIAGRGQIFSNCLVRATNSQNVCPEWFGAVNDGTTDCASAFNAAVYYLQYVGGVIDMLGGTYSVASTVTINKNKITLQGAGNNSTYIKAASASVYPIIVSGTTSVQVSNVMLRDFSIIASNSNNTTVGLQLYYTAFAIVERMQIQDFSIGMSFLRASNSQVSKVGATYTGANNGFIGFDINGGGTSGGNASSILRDCYTSGVSGKTNQSGFKMYGVYMSDFQFQMCETALTNYGFLFDYSTAPDYNIDVIVQNPIIDRYSTQGIYVHDLASGGVFMVYGGYTNPDTLGVASDNMLIENCAGRVVVTNHQFVAPTNYAYTYGVRAVNSFSFVISNNAFYELFEGVKTTACGYSQITGNVFKGTTHAFNKMVNVIGGARMMITSNAFDGLATNGVVIDATSDGCGIVGNCANVATIGTRYTNNGTNPVGGTAGATGLNSGT